MNTEPIFYDIYDFYYVPIWETNVFKISIISFLLLIILGVTLLIYLKRKRRKLTSWQWAILQLNNFSPDKLETKRDFKLFYFDLTSIIKKYFNKRFDWQTKEKTDEEFVEMLQNKNFDDELLLDLKKMLSGASWIKFANEDVLKIQSKKDLNVALKIIKKTIPLDS